MNGYEDSKSAELVRYVGSILLILFLLTIIRGLLVGNTAHAPILITPTISTVDLLIALSTPISTPHSSTLTEIATVRPINTPHPVRVKEIITETTLPTEETVIGQITSEPTIELLPTPIANDGDYTERLPILMYHYLSVPPASADIYRTDLSVDPAQFRQQLAHLHENGFTTIDLYDLTLALSNQRELPPKPVLLTFDDGYRDNYENAFPLLQEFGMKATFFIVTDVIEEGRPDYLTWKMVTEMSHAGMSMEMHTRTHPDLTLSEHDDQWEEIKGSQELILARTGHYPRFLAYPSGKYDEGVISVLREGDLWGAVTTKWGAVHTYRLRYELKRMRMRNETTIAVFSDMINLADWTKIGDE